VGQPVYPSLYEVNTRVWLGELAGAGGERLPLDQVPERAAEEIAALGFDWLWPMGVWQTGDAGRVVARAHPGLRSDYQAALADLQESDIAGSPFAVQSYSAHADFGGDDALARFRHLLQARGLRLLLDFVPNHTALDHPWVWQHPEYYITGDEGDLAREPGNYTRVETRLGPRALAHGRDPYFPGWTDTAQLNYRSPALRQAMAAELVRIAERCDGVRCDMAMLLLPDVIQRTWGHKSLPADGSPPVDAPFWPEAIARVRRRFPHFHFMAEAYWDLEWTLQQQGFDYTYDKRLYDRLSAREAEGVRGHLRAEPDYQRKSVRFLENHDEPRAAAAFPPDVHRAAATIAYLVPGLRFFHDGQLKGRRVRVPVQLGRRPREPVDAALSDFYRRLLDVVALPAVRDGRWRLLDCRAAWPDNPTGDQFVAFAWEGPQRERLLVAVNYGPRPGQCYVPVPFPELRGEQIRLRDRLGDNRFERTGNDLVERGLYLDVPPWHAQAVELLPLDGGLSDAAGPF
jgi:hypothetical protein